MQNYSSYIKTCQNIYDELTILDSILYALESICINLEANSEYYINDNYQTKLCEERNRYMALLTIARESVKNLEKSNENLEDILS